MIDIAGMKRNHILIIAAIALLVIGVTAAFYVSTENATGATKAEKLQQLVEASKSRLVVYNSSKEKPSPEVAQSRKWCNEGVAAWAAYAGRCANAEGEIRVVAKQVLACENNHRVYDGKKVKSCLSFLKRGSCDLLDYKREEMVLSLPEVLLLADKKGEAKPQPQLDCLGVF
jgi:hypothetical protein